MHMGVDAGIAPQGTAGTAAPSIEQTREAYDAPAFMLFTIGMSVGMFCKVAANGDVYIDWLQVERAAALPISLDDQGARMDRGAARALLAVRDGAWKPFRVGFR
jgi:hypothetical protein